MRDQVQSNTKLEPNRQDIGPGSSIEREFKASQFNEFLGCLDGKWVIYNNLSKFWKQNRS